MKSELGKSFEFSDVPRPRWNVIDVMTVVAPSAMPVPLFFDIDVSWAEALRKRYLELGYKVAITAILLKAIAIAQRDHPLTRTHQLPTGKLVTFNEITAGFTVERIVSGTPAVFFGTIKNVDSKSILEIAGELRAYGQDPIKSIPQLDLQARCLEFPRWVLKLILHLSVWSPLVRLKVLPATFGVSSVGRWGCKTGTPPCLTTTTFGVGEVTDRPVVVDGQVEVRPVISVTYVFDHRIIDGAPACRFMKNVIDLLQGSMENYVHDELELLRSSPLPVLPAKP
jgi:pyruvate/2-oxoglutarate dehydrogenase complex dihydrolipoamide acyltransferase (E2) component